MSDQFKVGEIAIVQNAVQGSFKHLNGTECEVISVPEPFVWNGIQYVYVIRCIDGDLYHAARYHLRKKRPPEQFEGELRIMRLFDAVPTKQTEPELV